MKGLIEVIINKWFCCHDWGIVEKVHTSNIFGIERMIYILECNKCGKIKKVKVRN